MPHETVLSDALLKQLMAVGQVDILVGLPTLNNAATVVDIARAINVCFNRDYLRLRTVMINSDAGSSDGTPELIRNVELNQADVVQTSHALRTMHRVTTPFHGLPGKLTALRIIFAAAELTQATTLVVIDPAGASTTAARVAELIAPVQRGEIEFLAPRYRRSPRDGLLVTQLVRPLVRAAYGVGLDEPLGGEFSCARRFATHCLDQQMWREDTARFAVDLWLRTEAVANGFSVAQIWRPPTISPSSATLRQAVRQIFLSLVLTLRAHEAYWRTANTVAELPTWGAEPDASAGLDWDHPAMAQQARRDIGEIRPLLEGVLDPALIVRLTDESSTAAPRLDDELWVRIVYAFLQAASRGTAAVEHLADMFVPLYMWRAAAYMACTAQDTPETAQSRLDALGNTFQRLKPAFVNSWAVAV